MIRESVIGTFVVGAFVVTTIVGIFVCVVLVLFFTSMWNGTVPYVILMLAI